VTPPGHVPRLPERDYGPTADAVRETRTCERVILGSGGVDPFRELLGYTRAVDDPKRYTISREKHVEANGKFADAVLREFGPGRWTCIATSRCGQRNGKRGQSAAS
jgi:hypothetical protein